MINSFADIMSNYDISQYNEKYRSDSRVLSPSEKSMLDSVIPVGGSVLDVGCGSANLYPAHIFTRTEDYTGIDIAAGQIERARANWPDKCFICGDFINTNFAVESYDAILFLYCFFHFPKETMPYVMGKAGKLLRKCGKILLLIRTEVDDNQLREEWCGTKMIWCHPGIEFVKELSWSLGLQCDVKLAEHNDHYVWLTLTK